MLAELIVKIGANLKEFTSGMDSVTSKLKETSKSIKETGEKMSTYLTLPIVGVGAASIKLASDLSESLNKVNVAFGDSATFVNEWAKKSVESMGLASGTALDSAALFGDMATSMGITQKEAANMSTSLTQLGADLGSFKNIPIEQAMTALNGIFTGETESLKSLGVVMTQARLEAFALTQGIQKNIKSMSEAELVNLRYAFVMSKTTNAQGDFARTQDGAANQMRIFQETLKQVGASFGEVLLPIFTKAITKLNDLLKSFTSLSAETKSYILIALAVTAAIGPMLFIIGSAIPVLASMTVGIRAMGVALQFLAYNPVGIVITSIGALIAITVSLYGSWDSLIKKMTSIFSIFSNEVQTITNNIQITFKRFELYLLNVFDSILKGFGIFSNDMSMMKSKIQQSINNDVIDNQTISMQQNIEGWKIYLESINKSAGQTDYFSTKFVKLGEQFKASSVSIKTETVAINENKVAIEELEKRRVKMIEDAWKQGDSLGKAIVDSLKKSYTEQELTQQTSLDKQFEKSKNHYSQVTTDVLKNSEKVRSEYQKTTDSNLKQLQKNYDNALYFIDLEAGLKVSSVRQQIDEINKLTDQENQALEEQLFNTEKNNKLKELSNLRAIPLNQFFDVKKNEDAQQKILDEIAQMDIKRDRETLLKQRSDKIEALRKQADDIRNQADLDKQSKETQYNTDVQREKDLLIEKVTNLENGYNNFKFWQDKQLSTTEENYKVQSAKLKENYKILNEQEAIEQVARQLILNKNQQAIIDLLATYNPKWKEVGISFGQSLLDGINSTSKSLDAAISNLMSKMQKISTGVDLKASVKKVDTSFMPNFNPLSLATGGLITKPTLAMLADGGQSEAVIPLNRLSDFQKTDTRIFLDSKEITRAIMNPMVDMIRSKTGVAY